jgi:hypothetical protein
MACTYADPDLVSGWARVSAKQDPASGLAGPYVCRHTVAGGPGSVQNLLCVCVCTRIRPTWLACTSESSWSSTSEPAGGPYVCVPAYAVDMTWRYHAATCVRAPRSFLLLERTGFSSWHHAGRCDNPRSGRASVQYVLIKTAISESIVLFMCSSKQRARDGGVCEQAGRRRARLAGPCNLQRQWQIMLRIDSYTTCMDRLAACNLAAT